MLLELWCWLFRLQDGLCFLEFGEPSFLAGEVGAQVIDFVLLSRDLVQDDINGRLLDPGLSG